MASLYEVVLVQSLDGQEVINSFNFLGDGTPAAVQFSFALTSAMGFIPDAGLYPAGIFSKLRQLQSTDLRYVETIVKDVYSLTDFYTRPFINTFGQVSNASGNLPTYNAYSFRTNRVTRGVRRGQRRFAGLVEGSVDNWGKLTDGNIALVNELAVLMSSTLTYNDEGNTLTFTPCIVGKQKYTTPSGKSAYRYYPTYAEQVNHLAKGVQWEGIQFITTQNSRKVGRGA